MATLSESLFPPSNRRRCSKGRPSYIEPNDISTINEEINIENSHSSSNSGFMYDDYDASNDMIEEDETAVDLCAFMAENPELTAPAMENPVDTDIDHSHSKFRVTSCELDSTPVILNDNPPLNSDMKSESPAANEPIVDPVSLPNFEHLVPNVDKFEYPSLAGIGCLPATTNDSVSGKENVNSVNSQKHNKKPFPKPRPRVFKKFPKFKPHQMKLQMMKDNKTSLQRFGKYLVVNCEMLDVPKFIRDNSNIKVHNWPPRKFPKIIKTNPVNKNANFYSKKTDVGKFVKVGKPIFKKPMVKPKTVQNSTINTVFKSYDPPSKTVIIKTNKWEPKIATNSNVHLGEPVDQSLLFNELTGPKPRGPSKIIRIFHPNKVDNKTKQPIALSVTKPGEVPKTFQIFRQGTSFKSIQPLPATAAQLNTSDPAIPVANNFTLIPNCDFTVIEPYVEKETEVVKTVMLPNKPVFSIPAQSSFISSPKSINKLSPANSKKLSSNGVFSNTKKVISGVPSHQVNTLSSKPFIKLASKNNENITRCEDNIINLPNIICDSDIKEVEDESQNTEDYTKLAVLKAQNEVENAIKNACSFGKRRKSSKTTDKRNANLQQTVKESALMGCHTYNSTLNDIIFGCASVDDDYIDVESEFSEFADENTGSDSSKDKMPESSDNMLLSKAKVKIKNKPLIKLETQIDSDTLSASECGDDSNDIIKHRSGLEFKNKKLNPIKTSRSAFGKSKNKVTLLPRKPKFIHSFAHVPMSKTGKLQNKYLKGTSKAIAAPTFKPSDMKAPEKKAKICSAKAKPESPLKKKTAKKTPTKSKPSDNIKSVQNNAQLSEEDIFSSSKKKQGKTPAKTRFSNRVKTEIDTVTSEDEALSSKEKLILDLKKISGQSMQKGSVAGKTKTSSKKNVSLQAKSLSSGDSVTEVKQVKQTRRKSTVPVSDSPKIKNKPLKVLFKKPKRGKKSSKYALLDSNDKKNNELLNSTFRSEDETNSPVAFTEEESSTESKTDTCSKSDMPKDFESLENDIQKDQTEVDNSDEDQDMKDLSLIKTQRSDAADKTLNADQEDENEIPNEKSEDTCIVSIDKEKLASEHVINDGNDKSVDSFEEKLDILEDNIRNNASNHANSQNLEINDASSAESISNSSKDLDIAVNDSELSDAENYSNHSDIVSGATENILNDKDVPIEIENILNNTEAAPNVKERILNDTEVVPNVTESILNDTKVVPNVENILNDTKVVRNVENILNDDEVVPSVTESILNDDKVVPSVIESILMDDKAVPNEAESTPSADNIPISKEADSVLKISENILNDGQNVPIAIVLNETDHISCEADHVVNDAQNENGEICNDTEAVTDIIENTAIDTITEPNEIEQTLNCKENVPIVNDNILNEAGNALKITKNILNDVDNVTIATEDVLNAPENVSDNESVPAEDISDSPEKALSPDENTTKSILEKLLTPAENSKKSKLENFSAPVEIVSDSEDLDSEDSNALEIDLSHEENISSPIQNISKTAEEKSSSTCTSPAKGTPKKTCPKIKISISKKMVAGTSENSNNSKKWYVSERKASIDSVHSDTVSESEVEQKQKETPVHLSKDDLPNVSSQTKKKSPVKTIPEGKSHANKEGISKPKRGRPKKHPTSEIEKPNGRTLLKPLTSQDNGTKVPSTSTNDQPEAVPTSKDQPEAVPTSKDQPEPLLAAKEIKKEINDSFNTPKGRKSLKKYSQELVVLPFQSGWMRELVYRGTEVKSIRQSDVYYFSPEGKKLRSVPEITNYLAKHKQYSDLTSQHFTFAKETIYREPFEVERSARQKSTILSPSKIKKEPKDDSPSVAPSPPKKKKESTKATPSSTTVKPRTSSTKKVDKSKTVNISAKSSKTNKDFSETTPSRPARLIVKRKPFDNSEDSRAASVTTPRWETRRSSNSNLSTPASDNVTESGEGTVKDNSSVKRPAVEHLTIGSVPKKPKVKYTYSKKSDSLMPRPCTHNCKYAVYPPSIQCTTCLCIFHSSCIPHQEFLGSMFFCRSCTARLELGGNASEENQDCTDPEIPPDLDISLLYPEIIVSGWRHITNAPPKDKPQNMYQLPAPPPLKEAPNIKPLLPSAVSLKSLPLPALKPAPTLEVSSSTPSATVADNVSSALPNSISLASHESSVTLPRTNVSSALSNSINLASHESPVTLPRTVQSTFPLPPGMLLKTHTLFNKYGMPVPPTSFRLMGNAQVPQQVFMVTSINKLIPNSPVPRTSNSPTITQTILPKTSTAASPVLSSTTQTASPVLSNMTTTASAMLSNLSALASGRSSNVSALPDDVGNASSFKPHIVRTYSLAKSDVNDGEHRVLGGGMKRSSEPSVLPPNTKIVRIDDTVARLTKDSMQRKIVKMGDTGSRLEIEPKCIYVNKSTITDEIPSKRTWDMKHMVMGYECLNSVFKQLNVCDLIRASQVCHSWNSLATQRFLWEHVSFHGLVITNWEQCCKALEKHQTKTVDFRGIESRRTEENLENGLLGKMHFLQGVKSLIFNEVSSSLLALIGVAMPMLLSLQCQFLSPTPTDIKLKKTEPVFDFASIKYFEKLKNLKIGSPKVKLQPLNKYSRMPHMANLQQLTLTAFQFKDAFALVNSLKNLPQLDILELGDCEGFTSKTYEPLGFLKKLTKLRLENGGSTKDCGLSLALSNMESLEDLELMNFKVPENLSTAIEKLRRLKNLSLWPNSQSEAAEVHYNAFNSLSEASHLSYLCWGIIAEGDTIPKNLLMKNPEKKSIQEIPYSALFEMAVEILPATRVEFKCCRRSLWLEFCNKRH